MSNPPGWIAPPAGQPRSDASPLTACLNGSRTRGDHPALPLDPLSIAGAARAVVAAGARLIHVHPRDSHGAESLDAIDVARTVRALRRSVPEVPIGLTTGVWVTGDPESQVAALRGWDRRFLPDVASVNFDEPEPERIGALLAEMGVAVEAGLWTVAAATRYMAWPERVAVARILVEPMEQEPDAAMATAEGILAVVAPETVPKQVHGYERPAWPILVWAASRGYEVRAGFEDMLDLPSGERAPDNAAIVAAAVAQCAQSHRR